MDQTKAVFPVRQVQAVFDALKDHNEAVERGKEKQKQESDKAEKVTRNFLGFIR